jgi:hypothetical protein
VRWLADAAVQDISDVDFQIAFTVTVTAPNTNVNWSIGSVHSINWTHNLGTTQSVRIEVSRDSGTTWAVIAAGVPNSSATFGTFSWTVVGPASRNARIRVTWTANPSIQDSSDVDFRIRGR